MGSRCSKMAYVVLENWEAQDGFIGLENML
jgi:hypothetical protein